MTTYSIIIPNTNSPHIAKIIDVLQLQMNIYPDGEIIVAGSDRFNLISPQQNLRVIPTSPQNCYASDKRNLAMLLAKGHIFLFLDDDCLPQPNWLAGHLTRHKMGEQIVGGAITFTRDHYLQLADNVSAFHDLLPFTNPGQRSYLATANLSVDRKVVENVGLMEKNKNRADDLEWTARFRSKGYKLFFDPAIIVNHDPLRYSLPEIWRHWTVDAPHTIRIRLRYKELLNTPPIARFRSLYLWGSPLIAAWATARSFSSLQTWFLFGHTLPVVFITKLAWCWSAYQHFPKKEAQKI